MDNFLLNKVVWRDGDIITEKHFTFLEKWIENLVALSNQSIYRYGYFRNPITQEHYNKKENISVHLIEGSQYRVDLEYIQVINPYGKFLKIDERRSLNLNIQLFKRDSEGHIIVYLHPLNLSTDDFEKIDRLSDEIYTGLRMYYQPYELSTSNNDGQGVPLIRFKIIGNYLDIDESFIPFGITLDSNTILANTYLKFLEKYERFRTIVTDYLYSHSARPGMQYVWELATGLFKIAEQFSPLFDNSSNFTTEFFKIYKKFINSIKAEISIFTIGYNQDYYRQQFSDLLEVIDKEVIRLNEQQYDLTYAFNIINESWDALYKYIGNLPEGLDVEKNLPLKLVELKKIAGSNKLSIFLEEEFEFKQGETLVTIELRSYSQQEPAHKNVRVTLGDVPYAMIKDLIGGLKSIRGEKLSYRIECPKEIINRSKANLITIYLPPPVGENVPDLRRYVSVKVRGV